jgi:hypothetical protein
MQISGMLHELKNSTFSEVLPKMKGYFPKISEIIATSGDTLRNLSDASQTTVLCYFPQISRILLKQNKPKIWRIFAKSKRYFLHISGVLC